MSLRVGSSSFLTGSPWALPAHTDKGTPFPILRDGCQHGRRLVGYSSWDGLRNSQGGLTDFDLGLMRSQVDPGSSYNDLTIL